MKTSSGAVATHPTSYSFALTTFQKLLEKTPATENLCYSPFGLQLVLSLMQDLLPAEARESFLKVFEYGWDSPAENMRALHRIRRVYADEPAIKVLNSLWLRDPQQFTSSAREKFIEEYGCELFNGDFGPSTVRELNGWVERNTAGRISGIVSDLSLDLLLALNVIYFCGRWLKPFEESLTEIQWFTLADGSKVQHPRMQMDRGFAYHEDSECQAVSLNYGGSPLGQSRFAMVVVLPKGSDLPAVLRDPSGRTLREDFVPRPGHLEWPRFTFKCDPRLTFEMLGLPSSLRIDRASVTATLRDEVPVSMKQRVWIRVDEVGTEAAAVTGVMVMSAVGNYKPPKPFRMIVDRPFYFLIMDNFTRVVVFMGRVANPASPSWGEH